MDQIYLLLGKEPFVQGYRNQKAQGSYGQGSEQWSVKIYWADQELADEFWQDLTSAGLFVSKRALVLRDAQKLQAGMWQKLDRLLARYRSEIWPFFVLGQDWERGKPKVPAVLKRTRCWQIAERRKWVWQSPGLNKEAIVRYLQDWARQNNLHLDRQCLFAAADLMPPDLAALKSELGKLRFYVQDKGRVEISDLQMISFNVPFDLFSFLRDLQAGKRLDKVWQVVMIAQQQGDVQFLLQFLGAMVREVRILWRMCHGEGKKIFLPVRVKGAKANLARQLGKQKLARIFRLLLQVEVGFKSGELAPAQAISLLAQELLILFSRHDSTPLFRS